MNVRSVPAPQKLASSVACDCGATRFLSLKTPVFSRTAGYIEEVISLPVNYIPGSCRMSHAATVIVVRGPETVATYAHVELARTVEVNSIVAEGDLLGYVEESSLRAHIGYQVESSVHEALAA